FLPLKISGARWPWTCSALAAEQAALGAAAVADLPGRCADPARRGAAAEHGYLELVAVVGQRDRARLAPAAEQGPGQRAEVVRVALGHVGRLHGDLDLGDEEPAGGAALARGRAGRHLVHVV